MLTELESKLMKTIPKENFYENVFDSILWNDCFLDTLEAYEGIKPKQARALLTTLEQKDFISVYGGKDGQLELREKGKLWLLENNICDKEGKLIK